MTTWHTIFTRIRTGRFVRIGGSVMEAGGSLVNIIALMLVLGLATVTVLWCLERPALILHIAAGDSVAVEQGGQVRLNKGLSFTTDTNRAYYYIWIADSKGNNVYRLPSVLLEDPASLSFNGKTVDIPKSLKPGSYSLMVYVKYELNPLKTEELTMKLAQVQVYPTSDAGDATTH